MSLRIQFTTGTLLLLAGLAMMGYSIYALKSAPYVCAAVLIWLCLVEYAVARAWWPDARELAAARRRPTT